MPPAKIATTEAIPESGTVTICYKGPTPLLLRLQVFEEVVETSLGGTRQIKRAMDMPGKERVTINGNSAPHGMSPAAPIQGGYALTFGVDAQWWAEWCRQNHDSDLLRQGLLFHIPKENDFGKPRENKKLRSGLERLDQDGDPRAPKRVKKEDAKEAA